MADLYFEIEHGGNHDSTIRAPRESRLPDFIGAPDGAGKKLGGLRVVIAGCGSVGQAVAIHCARLQVREISLVDSKPLKSSSMLTHGWAFPEDLGQPKATVIGRLVKQISPGTRVRVYDGRVGELGLRAFASADLAVLCTDNLLAEVEVGRCCRLLGVPVFQGSLHGASMTVQVRAWSNTADGPCPACSYTSAEFEALNSETEFSCEGGFGGRGAPRISGPVTASTSFLCALSADMTMVQLVRHWLGLGLPVLDSILEWNGFTHRSTVNPLQRKAGCGGEHTVCRRVPSNHAIGESSIRQLLIAGGAATKKNHAGMSLQLDDLLFCERASCGCPPSQQSGRFYSCGAGGGRAGEVCSTCGQKPVPSPFHCYEMVPLAELKACMDQPLSELGAGNAGWARLRDPEGSVLIGI